MGFGKMERCKRCNRKLKNKLSITIGFGPTCAKKEGIISTKLRSKVKSKNILDFAEDEK